MTLDNIEELEAIARMSRADPSNNPKTRKNWQRYNETARKNAHARPPTSLSVYQPSLPKLKFMEGKA
jgi:hypothetical protein